MNVHAEISLYPLRTRRVGLAVNGFVGHLRRAGLDVRIDNMSSTLAGTAEEVFAAVRRAFENVGDGADVVLVMKVSNACPAETGLEAGEGAAHG